ncbi:hypothetical protein RRG08_005037, partial [Elysia crispata]
GRISSSNMRIAFIICLALHIMPVDGVVVSTSDSPQTCENRFLEAAFSIVEEHQWCRAAEEYATCINGLTNLRSPTLKQRSLLKLRVWYKNEPRCNVESLING